MKIIDLLNKIANGEEVPKYIKYRDVSKHKYNTMMVCKENIVYQLDQCVIDLNDEVEILEEEKKIPEKLNVIAYEKCIHEVTHKEKQLALEIRETQIAFNEVIDYLKSKGE